MQRQMSTNGTSKMVSYPGLQWHFINKKNVSNKIWACFGMGIMQRHTQLSKYSTKNKFQEALVFAASHSKFFFFVGVYYAKISEFLSVLLSCCNEAFSKIKNVHLNGHLRSYLMSVIEPRTCALLGLQSRPKLVCVFYSCRRNYLRPGSSTPVPQVRTPAW